MGNTVRYIIAGGDCGVQELLDDLAIGRGWLDGISGFLLENGDMLAIFFFFSRCRFCMCVESVESVESGDSF